jgi:peptidyl-prolyl cis-trans isomerase A (cyclophilin A)
MRTTLIIIISVLFTLGFNSCKNANPRVKIATEFGNIVVEVFVDKAPVTANNFLRYVKEGRYKDATFYRVVRNDNQPNDSIRIEVIQGGLFEDNHPMELPPITHETTSQTGVLHKAGVISMARWKPGTATDDFFICVTDQPALDYGGLRNSDSQGFAAFGKVTDGMDVVRKIQEQPDTNQYLTPQIKITDISIIK